MKFKTLAIAMAVSASLGVSAAHAERVRAHERHSFTADVTRTTGSGKIMTRHTEQLATDTGFHRETTMTNPEGKTASRTVDGSYDPETKTYTRVVAGTRINGDSYSSERVTQRTEDGYNRSVERTNAAGETAKKDVTVVVDRANHTITKDVTAEGFNGEVHTSAQVKVYAKAGKSDDGQQDQQGQDQQNQQDSGDQQNQAE